MPIDRISARNVFQGRVVSIKRGTVSAQVSVDIGGGHTVVSTITVDSVDALGLKEGSEASVIVKASNVMLGVD